MRNLWLGSVLILAFGCGGETQQPNNPPTTTSSTATPPATGSATTVGTVTPPPKPPLADLIKKTMADLDTAWAAHDAAKVAATYSNDAVFVMPGPGGWKEENKDAIQKNMAGFFTAFPDVVMKPVRVFIKGNVVATEGVVSGTHTGDFMGDKGSGKKFGHRYFSVMWFNDDGLVMKEHIYHDHATMMGHLGKAHPQMKFRPLEALPTTTIEQVSPGDNAMEAKNEAAAKALYASFEKKDDKAFLAAWDDKAMYVDHTRHEDIKGKEGAKKWWGELLKSFPDFKVNPTSTMAIGEYVISEIECSGTFKADYNGVKATGKTGTTHYLNAVKFNHDGKVVWSGAFGSRAEFANVMGVPMPQPPAAKAPTGPTGAGTTPPAKK